MILAILQARVSSTRLPGKVLKEIIGKSMIQLEIERILKSKRIDKLILATSIDKSDDPLKKLCDKINIECFRGSLNDVLDRFYQAAKKYSTEHIVRLTGDCPLIDPEIIDEVIDFYINGNYDYAANALEPTYPDGLDVEIFKFSVLKNAWKSAKLSSEREHVTSYFNRQPKKFKIGHFKNKQDLSFLRWTVDEPKDFELVTAVYEDLYGINSNFNTSDILQFLEKNSKWKNYNIEYKRNEGYQKSIKEDEYVK
ncbi:MAG: glycosyltransferase family protein [Spirochaetia bacterium]|nr:glycosyltransferase family protein [Spirochaetia bacterium]